MDIGDTNDFEIRMSLNAWKKSCIDYDMRIFIPDTEFGGIIGDRETRTKSGEVIWTGDTWRGLLNMEVLEPPSGQDYLIISGELNEILRSLMERRFDDLFVVSSDDTGVEVSDYQFDRNCTLLYGIEKMLNSVGYRLDIKYKQNDAGMPGYVLIQAVQVMNYSEQTEFSQDGKVHFSVRDYRRGINHLICLGKGELKDRTVLHLYVQKDGSIGKMQYFTGLLHRAAVYDYSSVEDIKELENGGIKRLKELMDYRECRISVDDINLEIGDIISGRDYVTGIEVQKPIIQKILNVDNGRIGVRYKLKGENE